MAPVNNFDQLPLKDIHLPDPVSWWPPAPGWWLLLMLAAAVVFTQRWWMGGLRVRIRRRRLERLARRELDRIESAFKASADTAQSLQALSILLRRVAMSRYPRRRTAGLCGQEWASWLLKDDLHKALQGNSLSWLVEGTYQKDPAADVPSLIADIRRWLGCVGRGETAT